MRYMYLKRLAEQPLKDMLASDKVSVILGARQVGKTTLVEHVLAGQVAVFLNFDVEVDKARFLAAAALAPSDGLRSLGNPSVLVIDEAQRLPETSRIIKGWHDARLPAKFLLLGSSSLVLCLCDGRIPARHRRVVGELGHRRGRQAQCSARLAGGTVLLAHAGAVGSGPGGEARQWLAGF